MKRFHVHVSVNDLAQSIRFYSHLFGSAPSVEKADYAKWMLEDPRVNFAISRRGAAAGVDHLGLQVESAANPCCAPKKAAGIPVVAATSCC
jgi:predicted enzyme related to lactoylglutathione lyase